jgi:predicted Zn finger-like uncharacterized protein
MILTCPECATSYFVADGRVPAEGRKVKCASCGHRWTATLAGPAASVPAASPPKPGPEPAPEPELPAQAAPPDDIVAVAPEPAEEPPLAIRLRTAGRSRSRARAEGRSSAMVWAGAAALAAALIAGAIVFREQVVRLWPASSAAYAGLGLAVDGGGLVIEQVRAEPTFVDGRPALSVTGVIRNLRDEALDVPPVRVTLLNRAGKPVAAKIARPADLRAPAHALRRFTIAVVDPPSTARDLEVRFVTGEEGKSAPREAEAEPPPAAAPAPVSHGAATEHG